MDPDYDKMVREFLTPTVALFLFIFLIGALAVAKQILKDYTIVEKKLGRKTMEWLKKEEGIK